MSSDQFRGCDITTLLKWILAEEKQGQIFGIPRARFFVPRDSDPFRMYRYGQLLETPLGVAAGPHTQLSQNLISAWLTGARYLELKTVQVLDELAVTKPCIDMTDEGYNCEWSQELKLDRSFDEYLNAWIILHILKDRFGWGDPAESGFIFNMSVGYDLNGILSPTVQHFLARMGDCAAEKAEKVESLARFYPRVKDLVIPDCISDSITVSTMHGCPPHEVEKIGRYFVEQRRLNTTIKLNPTLLGSSDVRRILNDTLGFKVHAPDLAFEHDLKYPDGIALIRSLLESADNTGVAFNIKLTNTLETANQGQNLPDGEEMVYMSGRALHPISINLAARLQDEFEGALDISFCAGVSCFNVSDVIACNLGPVTVCSDILKPGGYGRLSQYLEELQKAMQVNRSKSLQDFILARDNGSDDYRKAALSNLKTYAGVVLKINDYHKNRFPYDNIKTDRELDLFDCIAAPCMVTCPVTQDIPGYMYHTARGDYDSAHRVILETNPFPNVQGMVCDHLCQTKCTRINYDEPLLIREIKRFIACRTNAPAGPTPAPSNGLKVAIIGAGPSGLACAHFLVLDGFEVQVFESKAFAGGWASDAIPDFRLDTASLKKDIDAIVALGVDIHYETKIDRKRFEKLRREFNYIYIAVGAQEGTELGIPGEAADGVLDQLEFLSAVRRGERPDLGKKVAVIGGGNSAMDAARTAKRLVGEGGTVNVIYRRTREEMPAAPEEIQAMLDEGVELTELTAPECMLVEDGRVTSNLCFRMALGEADDSGRPRPIKIDGSEFELSVDTVISAIGQRVNLDFFPEEKMEIDPMTGETQIENVFAGGDAVRGAATLIKAIADGKKTAETIRRRAGGDIGSGRQTDKRATDPAVLKSSRARRRRGATLPEIGFDARSGFDLVIQTLDQKTARKEAERCLMCDTLCSTCVTVCPNRANIEFEIEPVTLKVQQVESKNGGLAVSTVERLCIEQTHQVLNIGDFCNECGNCATFCPTSGAPYLDKAKFHLSEESFKDAEFGYHFTTADRLVYKRKDHHASLQTTTRGFVYEDESIRAEIDNDGTVRTAKLKGDSVKVVNLRHAVQMAILARAVGQVLPLALKNRGSNLD